MSECIAITAFNIDDSLEDRETGGGRFLPLNEGKILSNNNVELPVGEEGEICVKSPVQMLGYYNDEEETELTVDKNGFVHTGDLGYIDYKGIVYVTGRIKDIIIRNGINISSVNIEKKLEALKEIKRVAVVEIEDDKYG